MSIDDKLFTVKYVNNINSHLTNDTKECKNCKEKCCTFICPANVWQWNNETQTMTINYENCLECGACRIACPKHSIDWKYPQGNSGVTFKKG
ncbi:4Fe-4S dicluster domain-containing protein [bacterium]|nr:4Fe-4S dicluster domain-containing protein [bacterium]